MQVFISHSSTDKDFAARLCNDLVLYDIEVWYDEWSIRPGDSIPQAIESGLSNSDYVLVLLSQRAIESNWVIDEFNSTLYSVLSSGKQKLVPLKLEKCQIPKTLHHRKYLDFSNTDNYETTLEALVSFLHEDSAQGKAPNPTIPGFFGIKLLGEGAFSTVYKATESKTNAVKAIKVPKGRHNLLPEAAVMERLKGNPNIVPVDRTFLYRGRTALVMPYAGHSLKWFMANRKIHPNQIDQIVVWITKLLECLSFAHGKKIIHRDVKPSNILIDEFGDIRLVDFGLAQKIQYAEFQHSTIVRGTLCYMAPEQQLADPSNQQADIYSLGAVFYELVTGEKPVGRFRNPSHFNGDLPTRIEYVINRCLERDLETRYKSADEVIADLRRAAQRESRNSTDTSIVAKSPAMVRVIEAARLAATVPAPVTIVGETGVGKDLVAQLIFEEYAKRTLNAVPFVAVNMAALPEVMLQSMLFGHVKGAFSGAETDRSGIFHQANGGVLFLDEIGELSLAAQALLLRVLDSGEFVPVGGNAVLRVNVKVVTATNRNLQGQVEAGRFRHDLFSRITGFFISVPPLRERTADIPALIDHFLRTRGSSSRFSNAAMSILNSYPWPGNVRELRNVVESALTLAPDGAEIQPNHVSFRQMASRMMLHGIDSSLTLKAARSAAEKSAIESALRSSGQQIEDAASLLDISVGYLRKLQRKYQV